MMNFNLLCLGWLRAFLILIAIKVGLAQAAPLDFELTDGAKFVQLRHVAGSYTLVNFWRYDCPECVNEMPVLSALSQELTVIIVALHKPKETIFAPEKIQQHLSPALIQLYAPSNPGGLLAKFGNIKQVLPYTVLLNKNLEICASFTGLINQSEISQAMNYCQ